MNRLRITLLLTLITTYGHSQIDSTDLKQRYQKDVIYLSVPGYIKNDTRYRKRQLKTEFDFSSEGSKIFKLHQKDATKSFLYASLGALICLVAILPTNYAYNYKASDAIFYSSLIPFGASVHFSVRANKRMKRAIWLRNRDELLR